MAQKNKAEVYNKIYEDTLNILLNNAKVKEDFNTFCNYCEDKAIAMNLTEKDVAHFVTQVMATEHLTNILFRANVVERNPITIALKPLVTKVKQELTLPDDVKSFYKEETEKILKKYVKESCKK